MRFLAKNNGDFYDKFEFLNGVLIDVFRLGERNWNAHNPKSEHYLFGEIGETG